MVFPRSDGLAAQRSFYNMKYRGLASCCIFAAVIWCCLVAPSKAAVVTVKAASVEDASSPLGIGSQPPQLGWTIAASERNQKQSAYQIRVASSIDKLAVPDLWDTGKVDSDQSHFVTYEGKRLHSRLRYYWIVRIWDVHGHASAWSKPSWWETGLLNDSDWDAKWIARGGTVPVPPDIIKSQLPAVPSPLKTRDAQGQSFTTDRPIVSVSAEVPTFGATNSGFTLSLYKNGPGGELLARRRIDNHPNNEWATLRLDKPVPPGKYYLEQSDLVGQAGWYTYPDSKYSWGEAYANGKEVIGDRKTKWEVTGLQEPDGITSELRREFVLPKKIKQARLYITALGLYRAHINGKLVSDEHFAPGWTDYSKRIQYQTYDVTGLTRSGRNAIAVDLAPGWYAGNVGSLGPNQYGTLPYLRAQLEIIYTDDSVERIATDGNWKSTPGPIVHSDLVMGEQYDARLETPGWTMPGYDDTKWKAVLVGPEVKAALVAQIDPPVRTDREIRPIKVSRTKAGAYIFDMGQNMVGVVRLRLRGKAGQVVTLRHAEVLNPDGTLYTDNLRTAKATDQYIAKGRGTEVFEPIFTFHGFRYVEISGVGSRPDVVGRVLRTAMPLTMSLSTDVRMVNRLQENIQWGQRGNFLSVPMDTPARDERLGWTGDIAAFAGTATYNMQTLSFLSKWLTDLRDTQSKEGAFSEIAPTLQGIGVATPGWGDAGVSVPWVLYKRYGDRRVLEQNFDAMERWIAYLERDSHGYLRPGVGYGDWLNVNEETPKDLIATAFFADSACTVAKVARVLGKDPRHYDELCVNIRAAFMRAFVLADGRLKTETQTGYALALTMDLLPDNLREVAAGRLVQLIKGKDWHLATGFLGTPRLLPALSNSGHTDVAYRLLLQTSFPSWGYQIDKGATTMWERWDGIRPDGSFQNKAMNSFNHYAYGSVGEWMYENVAGIRATAPGFQKFVVKPIPGGSLHAATSRYETAYGQIDVRWSGEGGHFSLSVHVPVNTSAEIWVPANGRRVSGGGARFVRSENGYSIFEAGSGSYKLAAY
jgi:alpha-L-rhamnosidase